MAQEELIDPDAINPPRQPERVDVRAYNPSSLPAGTVLPFVLPQDRFQAASGMQQAQTPPEAVQRMIVPNTAYTPPAPAPAPVARSVAPAQGAVPAAAPGAPAAAPAAAPATPAAGRPADAKGLLSITADQFRNMTPEQREATLQAFQLQLAQQGERQSADYQKRLEPIEQKQRALIDRMDKGYDELARLQNQIPLRPEPLDKPMPEAPRGKTIDAEAFNKTYAFGMIAAALMGKKIGLTQAGALQAFSGAIKGYLDGNDQAYEAAVADWKNKSKQAEEQNRIQNENYLKILKNDRMPFEQKMAAMKLLSMQYENQGFLRAIEKANFDDADTHLARTENALKSTLSSADKVLTSIMAAEAKKETQKNRELSPEAKKYLGQYVAAGGPMFAAHALKDVIESAIAAGVSAQDLAKSQREMKASFAALRSLGTREGSIETVIQEMPKFIELLKESYQEVTRTGIVPINRIISAVASGTGSDAEIAVQGYANSVALSYSKIIGGGNSNTTDYAKKRAEHLINTALDYPQLNKVLEILTKEMKIAEKANKDAIGKFLEQHYKDDDVLPLDKSEQLAPKAPAPAAAARSGTQTPGAATPKAGGAPTKKSPETDPNKWKAARIEELKVLAPNPKEGDVTEPWSEPGSQFNGRRLEYRNGKWDIKKAKPQD